MSSSTTWTIDYADDEHKEDIKASYSSDPRLKKRWGDFERDVTNNPFRHPKPRRIVKLKDESLYGKGTYRYRNEPIRVVYYPEKKEKIVYPIEVASAENISYKRKSFK